MAGDLELRAGGVRLAQRALAPAGPARAIAEQRLCSVVQERCIAAPHAQPGHGAATHRGHQRLCGGLGRASDTPWVVLVFNPKGLCDAETEREKPILELNPELKLMISAGQLPDLKSSAETTSATEGALEAALKEGLKKTCLRKQNRSSDNDWVRTEPVSANL